MANFDVTIQADSGDSITFYGSRIGGGGEIRQIGYQSIDGLGEPDRRTTVTTKSGADGGLVVASDQQYDSRIVSLEAFAMLESMNGLNEFRASLRKALPIRENVLVLVSAPSGTTYGARAVVSNNKTSLVYSRKPRLLLDLDIDLTCPDPYWQDYSAENPNKVIINKVISGGLVWSESSLDWTTDGLVWSEGANRPTATNSGTETVYPVITITGATTNPVISNLTTGESIKVPLALTDGDVFEIDMNEETLKLNGSNVSNTIVDAAWWGLIVGVNQLQYTSSSDTDPAEVVLTWRDRYMEAI